MLFGVGGSPRILETLGPATWDRGVHAPLNTLLPHTCYQTKFRRANRNYGNPTDNFYPRVRPFKVTVCHWRRRSGFEVGGTKSGAKHRKYFYGAPNFVLCLSNAGAQYKTGQQPKIGGGAPTELRGTQWKTLKL